VAADYLTVEVIVLDMERAQAKNQAGTEPLTGYLAVQG
jgi:hypothetical protein